VPGSGCRVPGTVFGFQPSVLGPRSGRSMREGRTSLAPHPSMAGGRIPSTGDRVPGTWDPIPGTESAPRAGYRGPTLEGTRSDKRGLDSLSHLPAWEQTPPGPMDLTGELHPNRIGTAVFGGVGCGIGGAVGRYGGGSTQRPSSWSGGSSYGFSSGEWRSMGRRPTPAGVATASAVAIRLLRCPALNPVAGRITSKRGAF
jgi:hypothetical protein